MSSLLQHLLLAFVAVVTAVLTVPRLASAGEPPDGNDPCSTAGRNTCGTLGVGSYESYRYGERWFGDYRGVVPGIEHAYCIDLRYWYPNPKSRFRDAASPTLRNREGALVSVERRRRMAYAVWTDGRTTQPTQAAAVMLYVHGLMGDAAPGEVAADALGPTVAARYARVARDAARYHGPYRIETRLPGRLRVGNRATGSVRVLSATGNALPGITLRLDAAGAAGLPTHVHTNATGVARIWLTPSAVGALRLRVRTEALASTLPRIYTPTTPAAAQNGQRIVAPASQIVTKTVERTVVTQPHLETVVSATRVTPGSTVTDTVAVTGLGGATATIRAALYGPFPTRNAIVCTGRPVWTGTLQATGDGRFVTAPVRLDTPGFYTYRETIVPSDVVNGVETPCGELTETTLVARARPEVTTAASAEVVVPGASLHDRVRVQGLGGSSAVVELKLFGPFASRAAIHCSGSPAWSARFTVRGDGVHDSPSVELERAGFYAYRERILPSATVEGTRAVCGAAPETALVRPLVITGGAAATPGKPEAGSGDRTPVRVRIPAVGIDAPLVSSAVDVANGVLGVPDDILRPGWWRDGAAPGDRTGAILVAGHVDSASRGAGAFFGLQTSRRGTRVELTTRDGRTTLYRVVSVRLVPKEKLPTDIYSRRGPARLVLVTCGGPFEEARRHYRDNVVVTAVPV